MTLVCFAIKQEASPFRQLVGAESRLHIIVTGMGRHNAAQALRAAFAQQQPTRVLTCGFAGGLNPDLASGTVLFDADAETGLESALQAAGARHGRFHCLDRVVSTAEEKRATRALAGADAVEMESRVVRQLCREHHIPSATVRVILDEARQDLPLDFNSLMTPRQRIDGLKLAATLLRAPAKIAALIRLHEQSRSAAAALAAILARALGFQSHGRG
jgi:adenosylhomocysteine nucleosidase